MLAEWLPVGNARTWPEDCHRWHAQHGCQVRNARIIAQITPALLKLLRDFQQRCVDQRSIETRWGREMTLKVCQFLLFGWPGQQQHRIALLP